MSLIEKYLNKDGSLSGTTIPERHPIFYTEEEWKIIRETDQKSREHTENQAISKGPGSHCN